MPDPSDKQQQMGKITEEVRALLEERYRSVAESIQRKNWPDQSAEDARALLIPHLAEWAGVPEARSLNEIIDHDMEKLTWAIELGIQERWNARRILLEFDQSEATEKNLTEGRDPDTNRVALAHANFQKASARVAANEENLDRFLSALREKMDSLRNSLDLPDNTTTRQIIEMLDVQSGGQLISTMVEQLLPYVREAKNLDYDPPEADLREIFLEMLDET